MTAPFALPLVARGGAVCKREGWSVSDPVAVAVSHASDLAEARAEREARAAYIARAVNLHERLVEALRNSMRGSWCGEDYEAALAVLREAEAE